MSSYGILSPSFTKPKPIRMSKLSSLAVRSNSSPERPQRRSEDDEESPRKSISSPPRPVSTETDQIPGFEVHIKRVVEKFLAIDVMVKIIQMFGGSDKVQTNHQEASSNSPPKRKNIHQEESSSSSDSSDDSSSDFTSVDSDDEDQESLSYENGPAVKRSRLAGSLTRKQMRPRSTATISRNSSYKNRAAPKRSR